MEPSLVQGVFGFVVCSIHVDVMDRQEVNFDGTGFVLRSVRICRGQPD